MSKNSKTSSYRKTWLKERKKKDPIKHKAYQFRSNWRARAKKLGLEDTVPLAKDIDTWLRQQIPFTCYYTGEAIMEDELSIDHKIPIAGGGSYELGNLVITSPYINGCKGNLTDSQFKDLLSLITTWPDKGKSLLKRLRFSGGMYS